jgi:glycosyltransferase involved in cell wall biosynthesis
MRLTNVDPLMGADPALANGRDRPRALAVLHVIFSAGPTSSQLNEHCLPLASTRPITVCSFRPATAAVPGEISLHEGDGTVRGFLRALDGAMADGPHDVVHVHGQTLAAVLLMSNLVKRRPKRGWVFTIHNSYRSYQWRDRLLLYPIAARFPRVVACSEAVARSLPASLKKVAGHRLTAVPNGVDLVRVDDIVGRHRPGSTGRPFTVVSAGRLIARKNPLTVLGAFRRLGAEAHLVFIGGGDLEDRLRAAAHEARIARIEVTGLVGREEVYRRFGEADVFISCSSGEGLPVAVLEAMACRLPVVLSDIPPHREVVDGLDVVPLVPAGDVEAFAQELQRFARMEGTERAAIGELCRRHVEERFSLAAMHAGYARAYAEAMRS